MAWWMNKPCMVRMVQIGVIRSGYMNMASFLDLDQGVPVNI